MTKTTSAKSKGRFVLGFLVIGTFLIAGAIAIVSYYASGKYSQKTGVISGPKPGGLAPRFSVTSVSGKKLSVPVGSNQDTVLFFTTFNSCAICLKQANELVSIQSKYFANTKVVGIGIGSKVNTNSLKNFVNKIHNLNYEFYLQNNPKIPRIYNLKANNTIVVINSSRKVIFSGQNPSASTLKEAVGEALLES